MDESNEKKGVTLSKMFLIAMTGKQWSKQEQDWLDAHPKQKEFAEEMQQAARRYGVVGLLSDAEINALQSDPTWSSYEKRKDELFEERADAQKHSGDHRKRLTKDRSQSDPPQKG